MGQYIQVLEQMRSGQIELEKYVITKSLTKAPEDYPDAKNQPHVQARVAYLFPLVLICWATQKIYYLTTVQNFCWFPQVALRLRQNGYSGCSAGDTVPYIICSQQVLQNVVLHVLQYFITTTLQNIVIISL